MLRTLRPCGREPFDQADRKSLRPALCSEALAKLAMGSTMDAPRKDLTQAMGSSQLGRGQLGTAHLEVEQVRVAFKL